MILYPRLPQRVAADLAGELSTLPLRELVTRGGTSHPSVFYAPTGGSRITASQLEEIRKRVYIVAEKVGYPSPLADAKLRRQFDAECTVALYETMSLTPAEASHVGMWSFVACVMLPDLVRWRFPGGESTSKERFLGGIRGLRNVFGRLWWRAYLFQDEKQPNRFHYVAALGEDELVQITERPNLAGNTLFCRQLCKTFLETVEKSPKPSRSEIMRDVMKRLRRLMPITSFESLDEKKLQEVIEAIFSTSLSFLVKQASVAKEKSVPKPNAEDTIVSLNKEKGKQGRVTEKPGGGENLRDQEGKVLSS